MLYHQNYSLPTPPFIDVEGICNFRDIGGYPIPPSHAHSNSPTRSVRRGLIFRCAEPTRVTVSGMHKLQSLGINTIFDLRSAAEAMKDVKVIMETDGSMLERVSVPIFADEDSSDDELKRRSPVGSPGGQRRPESERGGMGKTSAAYRRCAEQMASGTDHGFTNAYREILAHAGPALRTILLHLRDKPNDPIILHCSLGRDRTGVVIAILLSLAGVPDHIIAREYQLTEVGLGPFREEIVWDVLGREHDPGPDAKLRGKNKVECRVGAREENVLEMLEVLRGDFGGAQGYVRSQCRLWDGDVDAVRRAMTVDVAPVHFSRDSGCWE